jgi:hypothetical protein
VTNSAFGHQLQVVDWVADCMTDGMTAQRRAVPDVLERDMSATMAEFGRGLGMAFPGAGIPGRLPEEARLFTLPLDGGRCEISAEPGPVRKIALLQLPTLRVRIKFLGGNQVQRSAFLTHMDLVMRRGGG